MPARTDKLNKPVAAGPDTRRRNTMDRFDEDNLTSYSAAARRLNTTGPALTAVADVIRAEKYQLAMTQTTTEITVKLAASGITPRRGLRKEELAVAYANHAVAGSDPSRELAELKTEHDRDKAAVRQLNRDLDEEARYAAEIAKLIASDDWQDHPRAVTAYGDEFLTAAERGRLARQVLRKISDGGELREAITHVAGTAMHTIMSFPRDIAVNGTGRPYQYAAIAKAVAATDFMTGPHALIAGDTIR
jgi:hypothetical protein